MVAHPVPRATKAGIILACHQKILELKWQAGKMPDFAGLMPDLPHEGGQTVGIYKKDADQVSLKNLPPCEEPGPGNPQIRTGWLTFRTPVMLSQK